MSEILKPLIREYAKAAANLVCDQAVADLHEIKDTLSGDDSSLENAWEEICAQAQGEESLYWNIYRDTMDTIALGKLDQLPHRDLASLWLQTDEGTDWQYDQEKEEEGAPISNRRSNLPPIPIYGEDVVRYIIE